MNDRRKALIAALNAIGFNQGDKLSLQEIGELERIMKDEYGIEVKIQDDELETMRTSMKTYVLENKPALEFCGTPPDGKARRRERRRQERMKNKSKKI